MMLIQHYLLTSSWLSFIELLLLGLFPLEANVEFIPILRSHRKVCTHTIDMTWFNCSNHSFSQATHGRNSRKKKINLMDWETIHALFGPKMHQSTQNPTKREGNSTLSCFKLRFWCLFQKEMILLFITSLTPVNWLDPRARKNLLLGCISGHLQLAVLSPAAPRHVASAWGSGGKQLFDF